MKCTLHAVNVKLFAKAVHCLAKLGSEIYIEPLEDGLAVKTVNSSRSAYASFLFLRPLFQVYDHQTSEENIDGSFKCKVAVKTILQGDVITMAQWRIWGALCFAPLFSFCFLVKKNILQLRWPKSVRFRSCRLGFDPSRVKPMSLKLVFTASLLGVQD